MIALFFSSGYFFLLFGMPKIFVEIQTRYVRQQKVRDTDPYGDDVC